MLIIAHIRKSDISESAELLVPHRRIVVLLPPTPLLQENKERMGELSGDKTSLLWATTRPILDFDRSTSSGA